MIKCKLAIPSIIFVTVLLVYLATATVCAHSSMRKSIAQSYAQTPIYFVENQGQLDKKIKYYYQGLNKSIFFTSKEILFSLGGATSHEYAHLTPHGQTEDLNVVGNTPLPGRVNVFRGKKPENWQRNISIYEEIIYLEVWPKVDLKFHGKNQQLEYDVVINSGGDPANVSIQYDGIKDACIDEYGNLILSFEMGTKMVQKCPVAYQDINNVRVERQAKFRIIKAPSKENMDTPLIYGFDVAAYDTGQPLVIDPVIEFATFLGGSEADYGIELDVDAEGNTIVAGVTLSPDFPITSNAYDSQFNGGHTDIFVTKIDKTGSQLIYATYIGGTDIELDDGDVSDDEDDLELYNFGLSVDEEGNAYIASNTRSSDFPTTPNAYSNKLNGTADVVVAKLNAAGNSLVYATYLGGSGWEEAGGIDVDINGNAYIVGDTNSADFPTTANVYSRTPYGEDDIFVAKLSPNGDYLLYSTYVGGSNWDESTDISIDSDGNAYILGGGDSRDYPTTESAFDRSYNDEGRPDYYDIYLTKINSTGSGLIYSTFLGGFKDDWAEGISIDDQGCAYVVGSTPSPDFPVTTGAYDTIFGDSVEGKGFVCKFSSDGRRLIYSTFLGEKTGIIGVDIDQSYNAIVAGGTFSSTFPTTEDAFNRNLNGLADAFIAKLSKNGDKLLYSTLIGGSASEGYEASFGGIKIDSYYDLHVSGLTRSDDFTTKSAVQPVYGGGYDTFILKISGLASQNPVQTQTKKAMPWIPLLLTDD